MRDWFRVTLKVFHELQPHGDRAVTKTKSFRYEVWIMNHHDGLSILVRTINQFDAFNCHVKDEKKTRVEASNYAEQLAKTLDCSVEEKHFQPRTNITWEEFNVVTATKIVVVGVRQ